MSLKVVSLCRQLMPPAYSFLIRSNKSSNCFGGLAFVNFCHLSLFLRTRSGWERFPTNLIIQCKRLSVNSKFSWSKVGRDFTPNSISNATYHHQHMPVNSNFSHLKVMDNSSLSNCLSS